MRIADISSTLGLPRSSTYDLVTTLIHETLLESADDGKVRLGLGLFELGNQYTRSVQLIDEARSVAAEVVGKVNETCHVAVLDGRDVVYLLKQEGDRVVRMVSAIGRRIPAHGTGVGKALLAYRTEDDLRDMYGGVELEKMTENTITDLDTLVAELKDVAERGYATDDRESSDDVSCVAAPVSDHTGTVMAAISVSVPTSRMTPDRSDELTAVVLDAAATLSTRLGHAAD